MEISALYIYPIKSLRGISLPSATLTTHGFPYDRRFMLFKDSGDLDVPDKQRYKSLHVGHVASMALFETRIARSHSGETVAQAGLRDDDSFIVHFNGSIDEGNEIEIPFVPPTDGLEIMDVDMYQSATKGYIMPHTYCDWFSKWFGFSAVLVYAGKNRRPVLGNIAPNASTRNASRQADHQRQLAASKSNSKGGWLSSISSLTSLITGGSNFTADMAVRNEQDYYLGFSDMSPYLIASTTSLEQVSTRLPEDVKADMTKFRPNIVISGAKKAFDEDYWAEIAISNSFSSNVQEKEPIHLAVTANCVRCASITVDYETGQFATGPDGTVYKKLQSDRRVDKGVPYSPAFGRYAFLPHGDVIEEGKGELVVRVGAKVDVSRRNEERTVMKWPGFGKTADEEWFPL